MRGAKEILDSFRQVLIKAVNCLRSEGLALREASRVLLLAAGLEAGMIAEHLLNNRLQMRVSKATEKVGTKTKQSVRTGQGELKHARNEGVMRGTLRHCRRGAE